MDRRHFLQISSAGLLQLALSSQLSPLEAKRLRGKNKYSIVILGDTHYDTEPVSVYHEKFSWPEGWQSRVRRGEFARYGEMWRDRGPRLIRRAARLIDKDTAMVLHMGDLVQGDCGDAGVHRQMLDNAMHLMKTTLGGVPFVTVCGNHDIRGVGAREVYDEYMSKRMSQELGKKIEGTDFYYTLGDDAYIVLDFNHRPKDALIEQMLRETEGARHTFIISHGPVIPADTGHCRWCFYGQDTPEYNEGRRHFRAEFAKRQAIVLCGHVHTTEFFDWWGDDGRITQLIMSSVWIDPSRANYVVDEEGPSNFGGLRKQIKKLRNGQPPKDESAFYAEYQPGLRAYSHSLAAGSYKLNVSPKHVTIDFYAGDSEDISHTFVMR